MFGKKRKREELEAAAAAAKRLLSSDDIDEIQLASRALRDAWFDAGFPPDSDAGDVLQTLDGHLADLKRRPYEQALRPCRNCSGRSFRISDERTLENFGEVRLVVCEACGHTMMFWANRSALETSSLFSKQITVSETGGPFR